MRRSIWSRLGIFLLVFCGVVAYVAMTDSGYAQLARSFLRSLLRTLF